MSGETPPRDDADSVRFKRARLFEDGFVLLCILSLWPLILGWEEAIYEYILYAALAGLVAIFVRRINRFRAAERQLEGRDDAQP